VAINRVGNVGVLSIVYSNCRESVETICSEAELYGT
jgi:hypothetical protein